jgi:hypothetical protein
MTLTLFVLRRTASLCSALLSCAGYTYCVVQSLSAWRTFKWDLESEWEGSEDPWNLTGLKLLSTLAIAYFAFAAVACVIGLWGIARVRPHNVLGTCLTHYNDHRVRQQKFASIATTLLETS